ncbi:MAG: biotin carboxylase N-terminal domain-containing protein [Pseudomonadota bacterium]
MFRKLLIANRGEIAVRIARTAKRLGIKTIAVYSDADRNAPHTRIADESVYIGPAAASESYLRIDKLLEAALNSGADAVHPGYGFLSENARFPEALEKAGISFIGPTAETIRAMGSKSAAKTLMQAADVPVLPGYEGEDQSLETFAKEADEIGYPVLLKASAGGGGKGMRLVTDARDLQEALTSGKREAQSAFGDDRFLLEKYLERPRHLEVQIFGDGRGEVVHVFERDCSIQRRHQKIIEEAPAPRLDERVRENLLAAGVRAGQAIDYRGAGTVEFLYDGDGGVYFMEMNTRLQVEHPVSEAISGLDFVEWQLRIAAGEGLPALQQDIARSGHAFEARLYAEDPAKQFAPSVGTLSHLELPVDARVDNGVEEGQTLSPHYDPMIAKIITHGVDRKSALDALRDALTQTRVAGLETNTRFLHAITCEETFAAGEVSTRFIEEHADALFADTDLGLAPGIAAALWHTQQRAEDNDPWLALTNWRGNQPDRATLGVRDEKGLRVLVLSRSADNGILAVVEHGASAAERRENAQPGERTELAVELDELTASTVRFSIDGEAHTATVAPHRQGQRVWLGVDYADVELVELASVAGQHKTAEGSLEAPMPGTVVAVNVGPGDEVAAGDTLLILEAMKMEHQVHAPAAGTVRRVLCPAGRQVAEGELLIELEENPA